ncbi:MAG TPA: alpha-N-acetylglucosaminidase [Ohtaekwangia sp.]|uniref:alpha-N-acetylglucosaminidase n=1 Tax=Ohtaekwangia sp. TaxID=2066019 RepID=UPI002F958AD0
MNKLKPMLYLCACLIFWAGCTSEKEKPHEDDAATALLKRVVKDKADAFVIEYINPENGFDVFELESKNEKIVLRGNNGVAVASALHYYLKNYCQQELSWNDMEAELQEPLQIVATKVRKVTPYKYRYYLNYCTFNYTMAWWDWNRWQQEIDWMALNGINMPLALTGEEAIWRDVYHTLNFTDKELEAFFSGPSYFSWLWMGNIDGWGGPLPQHWMDTHKELQKKIVARERSLGMTTVLPAFTGHVPPTFAQKFPNAKLKKTNWDAGFNDVYILDAEDSLFEKIGAMFLEAQTKEYGTDHFYSADTFNENVPPTTDSTYLSNISEKVYRSMANTDPKAVWVMQGWMFHYNDEFWKPTQMQALFAAIPDDGMIVLDLYSESHPVWKTNQAYYGKPWIWNMLQNFGGNVSMFGRMAHVAADPAAALHDPQAGKLTGIGLTPEGNVQNPALFSLMLENVWRSEPIDVSDWLKGYARRRYGADNPSVVAAWNILEKTVYNGGLGEGGPESIIVARPTFERTGHRVLTKLDYDPTELVKAWELLVNVADSFRTNEGFNYDLTDVTRQVLANYASPLQQKIAQAYQKKDIAAFHTYSEEFLKLIDDLDTVVATRQEFLLGKWIADARSWGETDAEKNIYEFNARDLVTLWGDKNSELHEYSNRQWAGLLKDFYKPRWEQFFTEIEKDLKQHKKSSLPALEEKLKDWEWQWATKTGNSYAVEPIGNTVDIAKSIFAKYHDRILAADKK